jgi:UDP-N-acetylglucosamine 2-epimerase (non-hydrolysing)
MEAGNRCFDQRVPEEVNRKIVDHLSDVNIVLTEHARRYLLAEGLPPDRIFKSGSHLQEVLDHFASHIEASRILSNLGLTPREYLLVSAHREENVDNDANLRSLLESVASLRDMYRRPVIVSTHPRTRKRLERLGLSEMDGVSFLKPFGYFDYVQLQKNAFCVVSDSGTITEESSILGFPAVTIRNTHERPEGMDEGTLIMCGLKADSVLEAVHVVTSQTHRPSKVPDYGAERASQKILRLVLSYIDYVRRVVWMNTPPPTTAN